MAEPKPKAQVQIKSLRLPWFLVIKRDVRKVFVQFMMNDNGQFRIRMKIIIVYTVNISFPKKQQ